MRHPSTPQMAVRQTALGCIALGIAASAHAAPTLTGWAALPPDTFAPGPASGQFSSPANGRTPPYPGQPVQGVSAVLSGPAPGTYYVMPDNGFGNRANSADALLRMYAVQPGFRSGSGGTGTVAPVDFSSGTPRPAFDATTFIGLRDPDRRLGFPIVASLPNYPNGAGNVPVAPEITSGRLLTGSDFDVESVRRDFRGNLWFGDEFGPFLLNTDPTGRVLQAEIPLPGVRSPDNPFLGGATPNLNRSQGFEGMASNPAGTRLLTLLEGTVAGDAARTLRIDEFDVARNGFTGTRFLYRLDARATAIGDMTAINDREFLVIERDSSSGDPNGFKRIFRIHLDRVDADGYLVKTEVVDLMNVADPLDLNGDGRTVFNFPFVTIESVLPLDASTLLVINDNNFPGGGGRGAGIADATEFLRIAIDPLGTAVPAPSSLALLAGGLAALVGAARRGDRAGGSLTRNARWLD